VALVALVVCIGGGLAALQFASSDRWSPAPDPVAATALPTVAPAGPIAEVVRLDRLTGARDRHAAPDVEAVPVRRLGSGTRRALRLASPPPAAGTAETSARPAAAVAVVPGRVVVPGASAIPAVEPAPVPAVAAPLRPAQYAKLDQALRGLVDSDPSTPVRVIVRTQPGQHTATADWLAAEGRDVHRVHGGFAGLTATLSVSDVAALAEDPAIVRLSIDAGDDPLVQAVECAVDAGVLVVVSAGNDGRDPETGLPGYSSRGPTWWLTDLVAPVNFIGGGAVPWAQWIVWGDRFVWGDRLVWGDLSSDALGAQSVRFSEVPVGD